MIKTVCLLAVLIDEPRMSVASGSQKSFYERAPCDYSRLLNPDSVTGDAQCRTQIINDLRTNSGSFLIRSGVGISDDLSRRSLGWLTLLSDFYSPPPETYQPCEPTALAPSVSPGFSNIDIDTRAMCSPTFPVSKVTALNETIVCYHYRNPDAVYTSGFFDLLIPFVAMMTTPDAGLIHKSYHVLNSVIRPGFSHFGETIPKLWRYRITQYIGATGPPDRWFDHLFLQIILSAPPAQYVRLRLRMAQLMFVFGTRGALATYMVMGENLWQILGNEKRIERPPLINNFNPVPTRVYTLLESRLDQITADIIGNITHLSDDEFFNRMGSIEPISDIESINFGVRYNQFGLIENRYSQHLWSNTFREPLKSSFVPPYPTRNQVYNALLDIQRIASDWTSAPILVQKEINQVLVDLCRIRASIAGLPRTFPESADLARLTSVLKPNDVDQRTFDDFIRNLDDVVKGRIFSHLVPSCPADTSADPLSWFWTKLHLVLSFALNIGYVQTNQHYTGISLDLLNRRIQSFNDAVGVFSSIVSGIGMVNEEFGFQELFPPDKYLIGYVIPEISTIHDNEGRLHLSGLSSAVLRNLILGSVNDGRDPNHQFLFGHVLSCGVTSNIAIAIVLLRESFADAYENYSVDRDEDDVILRTIARFKNLWTRLDFSEDAPTPAQSAETRFNSDEIRQEFFRTYLARIFDLYNLFLFRGTLDMVPEFNPLLETVAVNNTLASLRVTDGNYLKIFTCGPTSYLRIRNGADCSETFSRKEEVGWDMVNRIRKDEFILSRFNSGKLCSVPSSWTDLQTSVERALRDESTGWFGMTRTRRFLFVGGKDASKNLLLDELSSGLDCIGTGDEQGAPITQISCTFSLGTNQYILNRKKRESCLRSWMTEPGQSERIRSVCPSLGANFIRLQQAAYEAKIDEFKAMKSVLQDQEYDRKFKVGLVGPGGSHVRICDVRGEDCEIWPIEGRRIPDIPTLNKVVSESLLGVNYAPNFYKPEIWENPTTLPKDKTFDAANSGLSVVDNRAVLSCYFKTPQGQSFIIYRYWQIKPSTVSIENPRQSMQGHCTSAWNMRRLFLDKLNQVLNRPMRYRSSTGFEDNNQIMNYHPGRFESDNVFVEYKRFGVSGFRVSIPNSCSIEIEVPNTIYQTSVWEFVSRHFHQVCQPPSITPIPADLFVVDIPASFCDSESVYIRCRMFSGSELIVVTQSSPINSRNEFTNSIQCRRPDNMSAYDRTKSNHCLKLGAQLITRLRYAPSAPPAES